MCFRIADWKRGFRQEDAAVAWRDLEGGKRLCFKNIGCSIVADAMCLDACDEALIVGIGLRRGQIGVFSNLP